MPSDLTPEQREAAIETLSRGWHGEWADVIRHTDGIGSVPAPLWAHQKEAASRALDALLAAGWTPPAQPDAIAAAEARGRREGIEEAATLCDRLPLSEDWPSRIRALSSITPQNPTPDAVGHDTHVSKSQAWDAVSDAHRKSYAKGIAAALEACDETAITLRLAPGVLDGASLARTQIREAIASLLPKADRGGF